MSFNIMDMVKGQISDQLVGQIGGLLGESPDKARSAVDSALPTLMAGIGESAQDPGGADTLLNLVNRQDDSVVNNIGSMIGSNQSSELIESGTRGLGSLMGSNGVTSMISGLAGHTGLGKGSAGSLLGMLTPVVMGQLKRKSSADGLNASGLASMLKSQGSNISAAMPQGMLKHLEASGFGERTPGYTGGKVAAGAAAATAAAGAAAGTVRRGAENVTTGAAHTTRTATQPTAADTRTAASGTTAKATRPVETARTATTNTTTAARNTASSVSSTAGKATSSAADTARNTASNVSNKVERGVDAAGNKVGSAVDSTRTATSNATQTAKTTTTRTPDASTRSTTTGSTTTRDTTNRSSYEEPKRSGGFWKWLLPLALAVLAWFGFKQLGTKDVEVTDTATGVVESTTEAATDAASSATGAAGELGGQFSDFFGSTTETLGGITDADSATAALPQLEAANESLGGLTGMLSGADDSAKAAASEAVSNGMGNLSPIVDKLKGDSGIWSVLEPVLGPMMETLKGLMG